MANGALQQVARIERCDTDVSRKWLFHLDGFARSVLALRDVLVNVQKLLRNRRTARKWVDVDCVEQS